MHSVRLMPSTMKRFRYYEADDLTGPRTLPLFDRRIPKPESPLPNSAAHHGEIKWFGERLLIMAFERIIGEQFLGTIDPENPMSIVCSETNLIMPNLRDDQDRGYKCSVLPVDKRAGKWQFEL